MNDVRRVAFVSNRFLELQGLMPAALGGGLLFGLLVYQAVEVPGRLGTSSDAAVLGMLVGNLATMYLHASYRRTYGEAVATMRQKALAMLPTMLPMIGVIVDMTNQFDGRSGPSYAATALASCSVWVVLQDWPWRGHHAIGAAAGLVAAAVTASVAPSPAGFGVDPARANAFVLAYSLVGLGLLCNGIGDHLLLTRCLRPVDAVNPSPGALAMRGWRRAWGGLCAAGAGAVSLAFSNDFLSAFPIALMLAIIGSVWFPSLADTRRAFRDLGKRPLVVPEKGSVLRLGARELVAAAAVAFSATVQIALLWPARPTWLALTILVVSVTLAARSSDRRTPHVLRAIAVAIALGFFPALSPARALVALVCALGVAVTIDGLLEVKLPLVRQVEDMDPHDANTV
jgi:hypothetical protein